MFIKVMRKKTVEEGEEATLYTVYFPVSEAKSIGQQMSKIFLSERECVSDSTKQNSFKRSLLNKCEDEFNKQDIYVDWKTEKAAHEASKSTLTDAECAEKEEELSFRRMKIKKQMLGNIKCKYLTMSCTHSTDHFPPKKYLIYTLPIRFSYRSIVQEGLAQGKDYAILYWLPPKIGDER
jgi:hypothetical protein